MEELRKTVTCGTDQSYSSNHVNPYNECLSRRTRTLRSQNAVELVCAYAVGANLHWATARTWLRSPCDRLQYAYSVKFTMRVGEMDCACRR